jgi:hypothetical protein
MDSYPLTSLDLAQSCESGTRLTIFPRDGYQDVWVPDFAGMNLSQQIAHEPYVP